MSGFHILATACGWVGSALVLVGPQLRTRRALHINAMIAVTFLGIATLVDQVWYLFALQVVAFFNNAIAFWRFKDK